MSSPAQQAINDLRMVARDLAETQQRISKELVETQKEIAVRLTSIDERQSSLSERLAMHDRVFCEHIEKGPSPDAHNALVERVSQLEHANRWALRYAFGALGTALAAAFAAISKKIGF